MARPVVTEPTLTPAARMALIEPEQRAPFAPEDRHAAEVLVQHLFTPPRHAIDGLTYATAYRLAEGAVGGDLVDIYHFDNGDVEISIADISGKGAQAAIYAALVKYGLRCYASEGLSPERVLRSLDRAYLENNAFERAESFASVFVAIVDKDRGAFAYASAGHEPVVLVTPEGALRVLPPTAPLIGIFDDQHHLFGQRLVDVAPGTLLVAATDGVTEARSADGDFFGMDGFIGAVRDAAAGSPDAVVNEVLERVSRFSGGPLADDVAIVAVRIG